MIVPPGRLIVPSEATVPLGVASVDAVFTTAAAPLLFGEAAGLA